jgi:hypothetical protein
VTKTVNTFLRPVRKPGGQSRLLDVKRRSTVLVRLPNSQASLRLTDHPQMMRPALDPLAPEPSYPIDLAAEEIRLESVAPGYLLRVRAATDRLSQRASAVAALAAVEELSEIDLDAPTTSRYALVQRVKAGVKKLVWWYLRYIGEQTAAFGQAVTHLGQLILDRTERQEDRTAQLERKVAALGERVRTLEQDRPNC